MSELAYLAESYFHQDYELEAPTPLELVREFRDTEPPDVVANLERDVVAVLALDSEETLRNRWVNELHAAYEPDRRGSTYREWFEKVLEVLREPQ